MRARAIAMALGLSLLGAAPVQEPLPLVEAPDTLRYVQTRVVLLPVRDRIPPSDTLFTAGEESPSAIARTAALDRIARAIANVMERDDRVNWLGAADKLSAFTPSLARTEGTGLVRDRYHLGRDFYDDLRLADAAKSLEKAESSALDQFLDISDPTLLAKIELVLGLTHLERDHPGLAHVAFKKMWAVDPGRKFRKGYYPKAVERALSSAANDLRSSKRRTLAIDPERLQTFLAAVGADQAIGLTLVGTDSAPGIDLLVFDGQAGAITHRDHIIDAFGAGGAERIDRSVSRWLTCLSPERLDLIETPAPRASTGFTVDSNLAHGVYFAHPTRELFSNIGFAVNATYRVRPEIDVSFKIGLFSSIADSLRDLQGSLTSLRFVLGSGFWFGSPRWRWFIRPGGDLHYLGPFTVITDPDCKFFGTDSPRCPDSSVTSVDTSWQFGPNLATGVTGRINDSVYFIAQSNITLYVSFDEASHFNYLMGSEIGLGYRF